MGSTLAGNSPAVAANSDIGYPTFTGSPTPVPATPVSSTPRDGSCRRSSTPTLAAGAGSSTENDFWFDEMLARTGTAGSFDDDNQWLNDPRPRRVHEDAHPGALGFGGQVAYWESINDRGAYTITAQVGAATSSSPSQHAALAGAEPLAQRAHQRGSIRVDQTKFITQNNVPWPTCHHQQRRSSTTLQLRATSPYATSRQRQRADRQVNAFNNLTTLFPRLSGDGFTVSQRRAQPVGTVAAGAAVTAKVQWASSPTRSPSR